MALYHLLLCLIVAFVCADDTPKARGLRAVLGAFVGDAASMPLHWIYDTDQIKQMVGGKNPEFYNPPSCPFYSYKEGTGTPYGQQNSVVLDVMDSDSSHDLNPEALAEGYFRYYSAGGPCYTTPDNSTSCYQDASMRGFLANMKAGIHYPNCGINDSQADALAHMIPVVARYFGKPELQARVEQVIRVTQNVDQAVTFGWAGARILQRVLNGSSGLEAVTATVADLRSEGGVDALVLADNITTVLGLLNETHLDIVKAWGSACEFPHNLVTGSHLVAQLGTPGTAGIYVSGVRQVMLAGGDSGSRSMFVGACLAAIEGPGAVPTHWSDEMTIYPTVAQQASRVLGVPSY